MLSKSLLSLLQQRLEQFPATVADLNWSLVEKRLMASATKWKALTWMEETGGEPAAIGWDEAAKALLIVDCSPETPVGRRSLCYDEQALASRKENKPKGSAIGLAREQGLSLLDESQYRRLQELAPFDQKTSSWLQTPDAIRSLGGAIFGDRRYNQVFIYHNGAESYYAARGFRTCLLV
ncbi:MAG: DUF4256 family protein [Cryomorphaceae bacterium]|nr:DUF4256 family protein [Cryomorphaceae bacterium]